MGTCLRGQLDLCVTWPGSSGARIIGETWTTPTGTEEGATHLEWHREGAVVRTARCRYSTGWLFLLYAHVMASARNKLDRRVAHSLFPACHAPAHPQNPIISSRPPSSRSRLVAPVRPTQKRQRAWLVPATKQLFPTAVLSVSIQLAALFSCVLSVSMNPSPLCVPISFIFRLPVLASSSSSFVPEAATIGTDVSTRRATSAETRRRDIGFRFFLVFLFSLG